MHDFVIISLTAHLLKALLFKLTYKIDWIKFEIFILILNDRLIINLLFIYYVFEISLISHCFVKVLDYP